MSSSVSSSSHKRVQVCIRVRPPLSKTESIVCDSVVVKDKEHTISVVTNVANGSGTCFHFDQVLDRKTDQAGVYQAAASEIVDSVLNGYNGTIMAYGQTGAGKTFTMSGGKRSFEDRGICARAISSVFQQISRDSDHSFVVRVSYIEVYNENLYDLLNFNESHHSGRQSGGDNQSSNREDLVIQENDKGQTFVRGLLRPIVKTEEHAFDLLFQGETNRTIAEHCLNASSTRSHCIFTVYVERQANADADTDDLASSVAVFSKLHLVDLAGSERMKKTHVSGVMLKEASHINKSLTFLEQVVIALGDKKRSHIPYRQTPLTNLLKDSLGGNCRTMLIACVWPEDSHNDQTLATLKFATRMMRVKTSAVVNVAGGGGRTGSGSGSAETHVLLQKQITEIKRLKEELAMHDIISGRSCVDYELKSIRSASARGRYREQIEEFVRDETKRPHLQSLVQIEQLFTVFRELYLEKSQQGQPPITAASAFLAPPAVPTSVGSSESRMVKQFRAMRVKSPSSSDQQQVISKTKLPLLTRSSSFPVKASTDRPELDGDADDAVETRLPQIPLPAPSAYVNDQQRLQHVSDKELFDKFKKRDNPKPESLLDLDVAKQNLRDAKSQATTLGLEINKVKLNIDWLTLKLQDARACSPPRVGERGDVQAISSAMDSSTEFLVLQLKDAKKQYRETFEQFQEKKAEVKYLVKIKEQMLQKVTREFEVWKAEETTQVSSVGDVARLNAGVQ